MGKLAELLSHPNELLPLVRIYRASKAAAKLPKDPELAFCYQVLNDVSRSFAIVIQQLPNPLRDAICIFYLVLRGLDTVEDDMALPDDIKLPGLLTFHKKIYERGFTMQCGYNHYKQLMAKFDIVVNVFLGLEPGFQAVIADITRRMGEGMAEFITKDVNTVQEYDLYCHYVAGLVGIGLSQLFASSGLEDAGVAAKDTLANHMGLFLQKTNIIRDYLEDILEEPAPRMFWPREIWGVYGTELAAFKHQENRKAAVQCLNHMIVNALEHLPHCIKYMEQLQDVQVFRFCAIPQIMAAGTLALCYNNGMVFEGAVKMRRGQTACVFDSCSNLGDLFRWFTLFLAELDRKVHTEVEQSDPTLLKAQKLVAKHRALVSQSLTEWEAENSRVAGESPLTWLRDFTCLALSGTYFYFAFGLGSRLQGHGVPVDLQWLMQLIAAAPVLHRIVATVLLMVTLRVAMLSQR